MRIIKILLPTCLGILSVFGFIRIAAQANSMDPLPKAKIIYVDADAGGTANGLNWTNAYTSLQDALSTADFGDQIWVAKGIYYPDEGREQTNDVVSNTFKLVDGVKLYGGFDPHNGIDKFSERDWQSNVSILSGDIDHETMPDITDLNGVVTTTENITGSNAFHVVYGLNISDATFVDGFTITAGHAREVEGQSQDILGGGLYNISNGSPTLSNIIFSGNSAIIGGGYVIVPLAILPFCM